MDPMKFHLDGGIYMQREENGAVTLTAEDASHVVTDTIVLSREALLEMQAWLGIPTEPIVLKPRMMAAPGNIEVDLGRKPED
jgi:hypothetical protein